MLYTEKDFGHFLFFLKKDLFGFIFCVLTFHLQVCFYSMSTAHGSQKKEINTLELRDRQ